MQLGSLKTYFLGKRQLLTKKYQKCLELVLRIRYRSDSDKATTTVHFQSGSNFKNFHHNDMMPKIHPQYVFLAILTCHILNKFLLSDNWRINQ